MQKTSWLAMPTSMNEQLRIHAPSPARHGRSGAPCAYPGGKVRRPPAAVPSGRDLRAPLYGALGADIPRSTLIDWCGQATRFLQPRSTLIRKSVFASDRLHGPVQRLTTRRSGFWMPRAAAEDQGKRHPAGGCLQEVRGALRTAARWHGSGARGCVLGASVPRLP